MSIVTKTGDDGTTALMFGSRVSKNHPRVGAYGTCDELNAALGMVRAFAGSADLGPLVRSIQQDLVVLMGELAVADKDRDRYVEKGFRLVDAPMVQRLEEIIVGLERDEGISYRGWATPGDTGGSACLDLARTVCRRAERAVVDLIDSGGYVSPELIRYLNRLADLCWLCARREESRVGTLPADSECPPDPSRG